MRYHADYFNDKIVLSEKTNKKKDKHLATIRLRNLEDKVRIPVKYQVFEPDNTLLGIVECYYPRQDLISFRAEDNSLTSRLSFKPDPNEIVLKGKERSNFSYTLMEEQLSDLAKDSRTKMEPHGFQHQFVVLDADLSGTLSYFEKEEKEGIRRRGLLNINKAIPMRFIPLLMYKRLLADLEGKAIIQKAKSRSKPRVIVEESEEEEVIEVGDSKYAQFVRKHFRPLSLEDAFEYQDQGGEKKLLELYLNAGYPVMINGPTGNGKSVLAMDCANKLGLPYFKYTGNEDTRMSDLIGNFVPGPEDQQPYFAPGPLTLAFIHDGIFHFEEIAPVPQDVLTGLNTILEGGEMPIKTQYGFEVLHRGSNFKIIASGNLNRAYTSNEFNDAFLQRFRQIRFGYPDKESTLSIVFARTPNIDYDLADKLIKAVFEMRDLIENNNYQKDLGMKPLIAACQAVEARMHETKGLKNGLQRIIEDCIIHPLTTYDDLSFNGNGLAHELTEIAKKHISS